MRGVDAGTSHLGDLWNLIGVNAPATLGGGHGVPSLFSWPTLFSWIYEAKETPEVLK